MMVKTKKLGKISGVSIFQTPTGWRVKLGKKISKTHPIDKRFKTEVEAVSYVEGQLQARKNRTSDLEVMTDAQIADARKAVDLLKKHPMQSLLACVQDWLARQPETDPWTVNELCDSFVENRKNMKKVSAVYLDSLKVYHKKLKQDFGEIFIHELTKKNLELYLKSHFSKLAAKTYNHNVGQIKALCRYAVMKGRLIHDISETIETKGEEVLKVGILTPQDTFLLLEAAKEHAPELVVPWALQAFAGLRRAETSKFKWEGIKKKQIVILPEVAKTNAMRSIPILPPLRSILDWAEAESKPKDKEVLDVSLIKWNELRLKVLKKCSVKWTKNCLRHSFVSYRLAVVNDDARVALEAGHTAAMLHKHYKNVVEEDISDDYWKLYQENVKYIKKVIA